MRYRSLGRSGAVMSAVSLSLDDAGAPPKATQSLVFAALESGVSAFQVRADDRHRLAALGEALATVERELVTVMLRLPTADDRGVRDGPALVAALGEACAVVGLDRVDLVLLEPGQGGADPTAVEALHALRRQGRIRLVGAAGEGAAVDQLVAEADLDVLAAPFSLLSGWPERHRIKTAVDRGISVIGYGFWGEALSGAGGSAPAKRRSLFRLGRRRDAGSALTRLEGYGFLRTTPGWTAQEICLAYALTEPALSTVQATADSPATLEGLCAVPEREMPTALAAQIEMARFAHRR